jgi:hypothetical protein
VTNIAKARTQVRHDYLNSQLGLFIVSIGALAKVFRSHDFKSKFRDFLDRFINHRSFLDSFLVAAAYKNTEDIKSLLKTLSERIDKPSILEIKLQSILEINKVDVDKADAQLDDKVLEELYDKSGDTITTRGQPGPKKKEVLLQEYRALIMNELKQNVDQVIKSNLANMQALIKTLQVSQEQGVAIRKDSHRALVQDIRAGIHDIIVDKVCDVRCLYRLLADAIFQFKEFKELWSSHGWKGSVKAVQFVHALEEHYLASRMKKDSEDDTQQSDKGDEWTIDYLDVDHVRPILEAIDEDGTNYISVYEVDRFSKFKPKQWS